MQPKGLGLTVNKESRTEMKPVIGITPSSQIDVLPHGTFERYYLTAAYVRAVSAAGGIAIVVPPQPDVRRQLSGQLVPQHSARQWSGQL